MTKEEARKLIWSRNEVLDSMSREKAQQSIFLQVKELTEYQKAGTIFCYVSTEDEVDTWSLIAHALECGKRVGVPKCIGKGKMEVREICDFGQLQKGAYGIMEPVEACPPIKKEEIDLGIIPCISADREGNRLGHGAGFYDRFLADVKFPKILLCFRNLMMKKIPTDAHDVKMDQVIFEK